MLAQVHSVTWQRNRQWPVALPTPEGLPPHHHHVNPTGQVRKVRV